MFLPASEVLSVTCFEKTTPSFGELQLLFAVQDNLVLCSYTSLNHFTVVTQMFSHSILFQNFASSLVASRSQPRVCSYCARKGAELSSVLFRLAVLLRSVGICTLYRSQIKCFHSEY